MGIRGMGIRTFLAASAVILGAAAAARADLTYLLKPLSGSSGVHILSDTSIRIDPGVGDQTFTFDVYAKISNAVAGDGLNAGYMSFLSTPGATNLPVNITGATLDGSGPPYTGFWNSPTGPQYGVLRNADADGDIDLGSTRGADGSASFYYPSADPLGNVFIGGTITSGIMSVHIGTITAKVTDPTAGQTASMRVLPRYKSSTTFQHYWKENGVGLQGTGSSTNLGGGTGLVFAGTDISLFVGPVPEPGTLALLSAGAVAAVPLWRRWRRRRT